MAKKTTTTSSNTTKRARSNPSAAKVTRRSTKQDADSRPAEASTASARPASKAAEARPARPTSTESPLAHAHRQPLTPEQRARVIAETAYYRAERRGFEPGLEQQDWLEAEREVDGRNA